MLQLVKDKINVLKYHLCVLLEHTEIFLLEWSSDIRSHP